MNAASLDIRPRGSGSVLRVRVRPAARREGIDGCHGGALKVSVTAAPERGRANRAVAETLSATLGVPRGSVSVISGATARDKSLAFETLAPDELRDRLDALLGALPGT